MILTLSYIFLSIAVLSLLKAKSITRLYFIPIIVSILFLISSLYSNLRIYTDLLASLLLFAFVRDIVGKGFLTSPEFKPPVVFRNVTAICIAIITIALILEYFIPHESRSFSEIVYFGLSETILANTFMLLAYSRKNVYSRLGDYTILMIVSFLVVFDLAWDLIAYIVMYIVLPFDLKSCVNMIVKTVDVYLNYTFSLLFLLSTLRR